MHPSLNMGDILTLLAYELVGSGLGATAVSFACCCRSFEDPILDVLWRTQDRLTPLLKCLPKEVWTDADGKFHFRRIPTKIEWARFQKYTRRMREIEVNSYHSPITPEILLPLQLRTANEPLLPRLERFECRFITDAFIPFIPLFLSPRTTEIDVSFEGATVAAASMISMFPTLCPNIERVTIDNLKRDPVIIDAVSEMLLDCSRGSLRDFLVDSPLTEEAREVVYRLPKLSQLRTAIEGSERLPQLALPNLTRIGVEYGNSLDWLQGFRGATLDKLELVFFHSKFIQTGDLLGDFERVAHTTSIQNTLLQFMFYTPHSRNPNLSPLCSFKQLRRLEIQSSCNDGCPSRGIDDDVVTTLAQALPKLETIQIGNTPCAASTGVTAHGLIALASHCLNLSRLRIHFRGDTLVGLAANTSTTSLLTGKPVTSREECALTHLEVGLIPIPAQSNTTITLALLRLFPRISHVEYLNWDWKTVVENIENFRRIDTFLRRVGGGK